ncbi:hypothetical protein K457DRAFT_365358 [Linnemannia elongata AG-77]|uniref:Uncharacterized protein n=1 Tax=Linnemannia elongata AG-77 TaxID=1314771 RepID=A0A197K4F1_9FUNG|nr:hypothetical protein K457DRAFT_365358 [Linnemannia elongata AG-77]
MKSYSSLSALSHSLCYSFLGPARPDWLTELHCGHHLTHSFLVMNAILIKLRSSSPSPVSSFSYAPSTHLLLSYFLNANLRNTHTQALPCGSSTVDNCGVQWTISSPPAPFLSFHSQPSLTPVHTPLPLPTCLSKHGVAFFFFFLLCAVYVVISSRLTKHRLKGRGA